MPWIALDDGEKVIPEEVDSGESVVCIDCREDMFPRGPMSDGRARHFVHYGDQGIAGSGCGGGEGESDKHRKLKSQAVSGLRQKFEERFDICQPEVPIDVSGTPSVSDTRVADALVSFEGQHFLLGDGLVIEVQYRNLGKDTREVTADYLDAGYSVLWVDEGDFRDDRFILDESKGARITLHSEDVDQFRESRGGSVDSKQEDEPEADSDNPLRSQHPNPTFLRCGHAWREIIDSDEASGEFRCSECGCVFWKSGGNRYISNSRKPAGFSLGNRDCGIWRIKQEGEYICEGCGKSFN